MLLTWAAPALAASTFFVHGGGDGHGIGMSQYGAEGYAQHGKDYKFILGHFYQGTTLAPLSREPVVRVLLASGPAAFAGANSTGVKALNPSLTYMVRPNADGSLTVVGPKGKALGRYLSPLVVSGPGPLSLAGVGTYRGSLVFRPDGAGGVQTVEQVALEDYVRGVISAEVPSSWPAEALKAQAVAARTYAITTNVGGANYDLYPDTRSQMYRGVAAETPSTDAAVAATRGQVVTYGGVPVVTYFFNSSGGHTENIENVWPGSKPEPWLRGVSDPYDTPKIDPYAVRLYAMSLQAAAAKLGSLVKGSFLGIRVLKHGASPRVISAQVVGTGGSTTVSGTTLQHAFGLLTTYEVFTTITTLPGRAGAVGGQSSTSGGANAFAALVPLVSSMVAGAVPGVHGSVFAARSGTVSVQLQDRGRWRTVASGSLARDGSYDVALPHGGVYRVVYGGLDGPAVTVTG